MISPVLCENFESGKRNPNVYWDYMGLGGQCQYFFVTFYVLSRVWIHTRVIDDIRYRKEQSTRTCVQYCRTTINASLPFRKEIWRRLSPHRNDRNIT